jgi:hypothetical protein
VWISSSYRWLEVAEGFSGVRSFIGQITGPRRFAQCQGFLL